MSWKAVLFDMDGVLIDSEEYMAKTGVRALKKYGIEAKESDFAEFVGCGENRYVGGVAEKYGVPYRTEMKDYLYACYGEHVKEEANIPDGVLEVLHTLRSRGYKLAVCSSADRVKVLMNLGAIGAEETLFDHLVTGTDIKNPKPDPEIYQTGAASLGLAPAECIVVEDAPSGIRAAHAAGIDDSFHTMLKGPNAFAFGHEDAVAPAKVLKDAIKKYKKCEIMGGIINGTVSDAAAVNTLADLPSREVLLSRMLGSMMSPISGLAIVLDQIAKKGENAAE